MKEHRFDALTRAFGRRTSRRTTIGIGTAGIAGAALHIFEPGRAIAQQATPEVAPDISFLMVQTAGATTLAPVSGADHTLTLTGISAQTLFFSDRPARVAATVPTADFIGAWAQIFSDSPPNATLIAHREVGDATDVAVVVTLTAPSFDDASGTLTYNARILDAEQIADRVFEEAPLTSIDAPQEFAEAHLFIDDVQTCAMCVASTILSSGLAAAICGPTDGYDCG